MTKPFRQARVCVCGDHGFVGLTRGAVALVDADDVPLVDGHLWQRSREGYARRTDYSTGAKVEVKMHRIVCDCVGEVDHKSLDKLDNRRSNLREAPRSDNMANRKAWGAQKFKGVDYHKKDGVFRARISRSKSLILLGTFSTAEEAARAYDEAAVSVHGEFARTNAMLGLLPPETIERRRSDRDWG